MNIILSRKGFDSQYGGVPSPILPDGSIISFPIPSRFGRPLADLASSVGRMHSVAADLSRGKITALTNVHLDPDLWPGAAPRVEGWRATLGQVGRAQGHLRRQNVAAGDVFLFFGWFRPAEQHQGTWRYVLGAPDIHSLFGWLQVGEVMDLDTRPKTPAWLHDHPHVVHGPRIGDGNTLYVASDRLTINGTDVAMGGAGGFTRWSEGLRLTAPNAATKSIWRMPKWMAPKVGGPALSYHADPERWSTIDGLPHLKSVAKGQEFVREVDSVAGHRWLFQLIATHA